MTASLAHRRRVLDHLARAQGEQGAPSVLPPPVGRAALSPDIPWRVVLSGDGRAAINDAHGKTQFVSDNPSLAAWVVALVNEQARP